jgi:uncharacterized protein (DUF2164 family)
VRIELDKPTREALARSLARYLKSELDVELGGMDATLMLDFLSETLGPHYYNQALDDARTLLSSKMEALTDGLCELERSAKL